MAGRWRLADGLSLTHLRNGGWTIADLHRLSVHEVDEGTGAVLHAALTGISPDPTSDSASEVLDAAAASGILIKDIRDAVDARTTAQVAASN